MVTPRWAIKGSASISTGELSADGREELAVSGIVSAFVIEVEQERDWRRIFNESAVHGSMAGVWPEFEKLLVEDGRGPAGGDHVNEWSKEQLEINQLLVDRGATTPSFLWMIIGS